MIGCPSKSKRNCSDSWNCAAFWQPAISSHRWAEYLIRLQKRLFNESFYCHFICPLILTGTSSRCQETLWLGECYIWNCVQALKWISNVKVIKANIGDAHAMGNKPIVFIRQVHHDLSNERFAKICPRRCLLWSPTLLCLKVMNSQKTLRTGFYSSCFPKLYYVLVFKQIICFW